MEGEGSISLAPRFVDPDGPDNDPATYEDNDHHLMPDSPCIDGAMNEDWMWQALDLGGNPRILVGASSVTVDIGGYEVRFPLAIARRTEGDIELSWDARPVRRYTVLSSHDLATQPWAEETTISGGKSGSAAV